MKRGTKIFWIVAGTLLLVGVVAFVSADIAVSRLATREVNKTLAALPFDTVSVGAVRVKLFSGLAEVDDIRLAYRGEGLARKKDTVYPGVDIRVERVFVGRLFYSLLVKKKVLVTDLKITRPQVELWMDEEHPELCFPEMPKDTAPMENPLKSIELLRLHVQNADLKLHSLRTQLDLVVDSCSLAVNDLRYDSVFSYCDSVYSLSLQHAAVMLPDGRMRIETSDLEHADQGALRLGKTRIANTMPRKRLGDIVREPITWMDMTVGSVETAPLNPIRKALAKDFSLDYLNVTVDKMDIFRDERYAPKEPFLMPQTIMTSLPVTFSLKQVDASIKLLLIQLATTNKNIGNMQLGDIRAKVENVTNRRGATMHVRGGCPLAGGLADAEMTMTMNKDADFMMRLHAEGVNGAVLNTLIRPLVGITFACDIDTLDTRYTGNSLKAEGSFRLLYHGLHVEVHKEDDIPYKIITEHAKTFTALGNTLIPKSNPTAVDVHPRAYSVEWKRDEWKPVPLYLFGPCIDGAKKTMLPGLYVHKQIKK